VIAWTLLSGSAQAQEVEDAKHIPSTLNMKEGEIRRFKKVGIAATSDHKIAKIAVMDQVLTVRAIKTGTCFIFVYPPNAGAEAVKNNTKHQITVKVTTD
jgi:hypothetical protein